MHRTVHDFALQGCRLIDIDQINAMLREAVHTFVYELPSHAKHCAGLPPIQAHPELAATASRFQPEEELAHFDQERIDRFLATLAWERRVGKTGQVDIGAHVYSVGRSHARKLVTIRYHPPTRELVFFGQCEGTGKDGEELIRHVMQGCDIANLVGFAVPELAPGPQQLLLPWSFVQNGVTC